MIRFHLDENVDHAIAHGLRVRGIDVTTASDTELISGSDDMHVAFALKEQRINLTHDVDFLRLHASGADHAGIVFCQKGTRHVGEIIRFLCLIHDCMALEEIRREVQFI